MSRSQFSRVLLELRAQNVLGLVELTALDKLSDDGKVLDMDQSKMW